MWSVVLHETASAERLIGVVGAQLDGFRPGSQAMRATSRLTTEIADRMFFVDFLSYGQEWGN
jgi:hypothetical protein